MHVVPPLKEGTVREFLKTLDFVADPALCDASQTLQILKLKILFTAYFQYAVNNIYNVDHFKEIYKYTFSCHIT